MLFSYEEIRKATGALPVNAFSGQGVRSITTDSRKPSPDSLFLAIPGEDLRRARLSGGRACQRSNPSLCGEEEPGETSAGRSRAAGGFHRDGVSAACCLSPETLRRQNDRADRIQRKDQHQGDAPRIFEHVFGKDAVLATEGNTNNQIGVPQNLLRLTPRHRFCILEMGTNHPGEIEPLAAAAEPDAD